MKHGAILQILRTKFEVLRTKFLRLRRKFEIQAATLIRLHTIFAQKREIQCEFEDKAE